MAKMLCPAMNERQESSSNFRPDLERYLASRCRRGIPGPLKVREIAVDVISDCFGAKIGCGVKISLKVVYYGQGPLMSGCGRRASPIEELVGYQRVWRNDFASGRCGSTEPHFFNHSRQARSRQILRIALEAAFRQVEPYQFFFCAWLFHGVKRDHLAKTGPSSGKNRPDAATPRKNPQADCSAHRSPDPP